MLHNKFRGNGSAGSGEEDFEGFNHIWTWQPSWSCDPHAAKKISFPYPRRRHIKFGFDRPNGFCEEDV